MCGGDYHLSWKHPVSLEVCRGLRTAIRYDRFCQESFNPPILSYRATSTLKISLDPIRISFLHVGASVDLQSCLGHSWVWLPCPQSHFGVIKYKYQFEYTCVVHLITFQTVLIELPLYPVSSGVSVFIGVFFVPNLDLSSWIRARDRLTRASDQLNQRLDQRDMDSQVVIANQFFAAMASIQEVIVGLGQRIDGQKTQQIPHQDSAWYGLTIPPPPPLNQLVPYLALYVLHSQTDATPLPVVAPILTSEDAHARMDRLEQRMRQMRISNGAISWDDFDGVPVASLPAQFRMPEIERYMGISCPKIHLRLSNSVMRAHGLDETQLIMLFPMSLCSAAQRWFVSLDASRCKTWDDLAEEFLRQIAFNTVIDVSRKELEALRQGPKESMTSYISRWKEKITQIIDYPSERDQISMILRSLQSRFARNLMGFPHTDFGSLVQALYGIEEGIARGLWLDSSSSDSKRKKPSGGQRLEDKGTIGSIESRSPRHYQTVKQTLGAYYPQCYAQYRPPRPITPTYLHSTPKHVFAAHVSERPSTLYPRPHKLIFLLYRGRHDSSPSQVCL